MTIETHKKGKITILTLTGQLTLGEGDVQLRDALKSQLSEGNTLFVFDMLNLRYMDSAGIGELVACNKRVRERQGEVKLTLNPKGRQILEIPQIHRIFDIHDDVESAVKSFAG